MTTSAPLGPPTRPTPRAAPRPQRPLARRPEILLLIALGGAGGTAARAAVEAAFSPPEAAAWPWATFLINVSGAFVLGLLLQALALTGPDLGWRRAVRLGLGTGALGGYTTYSAFVVETLTLGRAAGVGRAAAYDLASLLLGFVAAYAGIRLAGAWGRVHRTPRRPR